LNLMAPMAMAKAAHSLLTDGGAIINLASLGGTQIWKERIDYNVSKSAVITLTQALARELASRRITVNGVAPGAIQVEHETAERMGIAEDKVPFGKYGTPEDIAKAVLYFAFDAPYVTGQCLVVDGGRSVL
jgi:pteridine reductase